MMEVRARALGAPLLLPTILLLLLHPLPTPAKLNQLKSLRGEKQQQQQQQQQQPPSPSPSPSPRRNPLRYAKARFPHKHLLVGFVTSDHAACPRCEAYDADIWQPLAAAVRGSRELDFRVALVTVDCAKFESTCKRNGIADAGRLSSPAVHLLPPRQSPAQRAGWWAKAKPSSRLQFSGDHSESSLRGFLLKHVQERPEEL